VQGWYLLLIVAGRQVGLVGTHKVFAVDDSTVVPIGAIPKADHEMTRVDEARYKRLFFGIDVSSFYFSYSYATSDHGMSCRVDQGASADRVHFNRSGVTGTLDVTGDRFCIEVRLGMLMSVFASTIEAKLRQKLEQQIEKAQAGQGASA
jgi:hypothetical protein